MADLDTAISELISAINQANAEANADASTNESVGESLAATQKAILELQKVELRVKALELELAEKEKAVGASRDNYFGAIEEVRTALAAEGALSDAIETMAAEALKTGLGLGSVAELAPLLTVVDDYDKKTDADLQTAHDDLDAALTELKDVEKKLDEKKANLDSISSAIGSLAANAKQAFTTAKGDLDALDTVQGDKRFYEAVVYLNDLKKGRSTLKDEIDKTFAVLNYDADGTKATLEARLTEAWNDAKAAFENALSDRIEKETAAFSKQLALIEAQAVAKTRTARRLIDLAAAIEGGSTGGNGGNGGDGDNGDTGGNGNGNGSNGDGGDS